MASFTSMPHGYDYEFVEEVHHDYICVICQHPMEKPVQTKCGHRFCKACLDETLKRKQQCPEDRESLTDQDIFPDLATERKIHSFKIKCPQAGCYWQGELSNIEDHKIRCDSKLVPCIYQNIGCCIKVQRKDLNDHIKNLEQHFPLAIERILTLESESAAIMTPRDEIRHYIWKMKNFKQHLEKAKQLDLDITLESKPFNTHKYGYKLKLQLVPNGYGDVKAHVSVYLIVMRGEYDAILTWPFDWKSNFILMDQEPHPTKRKDIAHYLETNHREFHDCCKRPTTEENNGVGLPKFVSHEILSTGNYIDDDGVLFLKLELQKS